MKMPSNNALMLNGAAIMVMGVAAITFVKSFFIVPTVPSCAIHYPKAVAYGLERNGQLVSATDVQAASGGDDAGVLENLSIVRLKGAPASAVMAINLPKGSASPDHISDTRGGVKFPWRPRSMPEAAKEVCLSYHIFLPADFDYSGGNGVLPGLYGQSPSLGAADDERFSIAFGWVAGGDIRANILLSAKRKQFPQMVGAGERIPLGRWARIDQEAVLNTPGKYDGSFRVWIDGDLKAEHAEIAYRLSDDGRFEGVRAAVHFGAGKAEHAGRAVKAEQIQITPFELRWK